MKGMLKLKKELIIIIVIIITIVIAHIVSQTYTEKFFDEIEDDLSALEENLLKPESNSEELEDDIQDMQNKWKSKYDSFACFVEHDELEKVQTQLISISANIKVKDYKKSVDEIEKCKFILQHIKDKDSFKIVNIF